MLRYLDSATCTKPQRLTSRTAELTALLHTSHRLSVILETMTRLEQGEVLEDRYRIDRAIARGGMSTVYRCLDLRLGRAVAAKVMDGDYLDDPISRDRFTREARAMAQLRHPNILGVYDFSSAGEHVYLITELITGGTLGELLAETGPLDPATATVMLRSVLQGLSVAHAKGLVHRDIKPHNVLIDADGGIKLADFGLVRAMNNTQKTSNQIVGTVSYISPEQVDGGRITPATDVYSAGIVLFELLTGQVPFVGETSLGRALARLHNDVPAPSDLIDGVPPLFDALVASATTRNPDERFRDAREFLDALDDVASELQLPHVAVPVPENAAAHRAAVHTPFAESPLPEATAHLPLADDEDKPAGIIPNSSASRAPNGVPNDSASSDNAQPRETLADGTVADTPGRPTPPAAMPAGFGGPVSPAAPPVAPVPPRAHNETRLEGPFADKPQPPAPPAAASPAPKEKPLSNRSTVKLLLVVLGMAVATGAVAVASWWFGSGGYGYMPQLWL